MVSIVAAQLPTSTLFPEISFASRSLSSTSEPNDIGGLLNPLTNADNTGIRKRLAGKSFFLNKRGPVLKEGEGQAHNGNDGHVQLDLVRGNDLVKGKRYE